MRSVFKGLAVAVCLPTAIGAAWVGSAWAGIAPWPRPIGEWIAQERKNEYLDLAHQHNAVVLADKIGYRTAREFRRQLMNLDESKEIHIIIDSNGGDALHGWEICQALRDKPTPRYVSHVPERAMSAALYVILHSHEIRAPSTALVSRADPRIAFPTAGGFHIDAAIADVLLAHSQGELSGMEVLGAYEARRWMEYEKRHFEFLSHYRRWTPSQAGDIHTTWLADIGRIHGETMGVKALESVHGLKVSVGPPADFVMPVLQAYRLANTSSVAVDDDEETLDHNDDDDA